jgi:hypothetical protein
MRLQLILSYTEIEYECESNFHSEKLPKNKGGR